MLHVSTGRTIMIVGNGQVPDGAAAIIDAADLVIRFNDCRSFGRAGEKTDIVAVCNTGRPALAMLGGGTWKRNAAVARATAIWCVRAPETYEALRPNLAKTHKELDDFCDDYSSGFHAFAMATGRGFHIVPAIVHALVDADLNLMDVQDYVVPSSGVIVIAEILANWLRPGDRVVLAGFGHGGWDGHPFEAERKWVDTHVSAGRLDRIENTMAEDVCANSAVSVRRQSKNLEFKAPGGRLEDLRGIVNPGFPLSDADINRWVKEVRGGACGDEEE